VVKIPDEKSIKEEGTSENDASTNWKAILD
jgi:hypothetical protein